MLGKMRMAVVTVCAAGVVGGLGVSSALAGEITGNGKLNEPNGNSLCAFSGQEDLEWFYDNKDTLPKPEETKGDHGHSQSWGQIPKSVRDALTQAGTTLGSRVTRTRPTGCHPSDDLMRLAPTLRWRQLPGGG
jgi:hypothetical protein